MTVDARKRRRRRGTVEDTDYPDDPDPPTTTTTTTTLPSLQPSITLPPAFVSALDLPPVSPADDFLYNPLLLLMDYGRAYPNQLCAGMRASLGNNGIWRCSLFERFPHVSLLGSGSYGAIALVSDQPAPPSPLPPPPPPPPPLLSSPPSSPSGSQPPQAATRRYIVKAEAQMEFTVAESQEEQSSRSIDMPPEVPAWRYKVDKTWWRELAALIMFRHLSNTKLIYNLLTLIDWTRCWIRLADVFPHSDEGTIHADIGAPPSVVIPYQLLLLEVAEGDCYRLLRGNTSIMELPVGSEGDAIQYLPIASQEHFARAFLVQVYATLALLHQWDVMHGHNDLALRNVLWSRVPRQHHDAGFLYEVRPGVWFESRFEHTLHRRFMLADFGFAVVNYSERSQDKPFDSPGSVRQAVFSPLDTEYTGSEATRIHERFDLTNILQSLRDVIDTPALQQLHERVARTFRDADVPHDAPPDYSGHYLGRLDYDPAGVLTDMGFFDSVRLSQAAVDSGEVARREARGWIVIYNTAVVETPWDVMEVPR